MTTNSVLLRALMAVTLALCFALGGPTAALLLPPSFEEKAGDVDDPVVVCVSTLKRVREQPSCGHRESPPQRIGATAGRCAGRHVPLPRVIVTAEWSVPLRC